MVLHGHLWDRGFSSWLIIWWFFLLLNFFCSIHLHTSCYNCFFISWFPPKNIVISYLVLKYCQHQVGVCDCCVELTKRSLSREQERQKLYSEYKASLSCMLPDDPQDELLSSFYHVLNPFYLPFVTIHICSVQVFLIHLLLGFSPSISNLPIPAINQWSKIPEFLLYLLIWTSITYTKP